jgi:hypothetical protein
VAVGVVGGQGLKIMRGGVSPLKPNIECIGVGWFKLLEVVQGTLGVRWLRWLCGVRDEKREIGQGWVF